jgi:hypothetical protein
MQGGALASTQYHDRGRTVDVEPTHIEVEGDFVRFSRPTLTPFLFVAFRLFTLTIGRVPALAAWLKRRLVRTLIYRQRHVRVHLTRRVEFDERSVTVRDRLRGPDGDRLETLQWSARFATIHMGSSRYFVAHELARLAPGGSIDTTSLPEGIEIVRRIEVPAMQGQR